MTRYILALALFCLSAMTPLYADCIDDAASYQHVSADLVRSIAQHESNMRVDAVHTNGDGSEDIGLMQINSSWLPSLRRYGIGREQLFNACVNAYVGTWILARNISRYGPTWKAVGAYNASSSSKRLIYATAIYQRLHQPGK